MEEIAGREKTVTVKDLASLWGGRPSSVTRTVNWLVVLASASVVGQLRRPLVELMLASGGAPGSRLKVSPFAGMSGSVAELEIVRMDPACRAWSATPARTGGLLVSNTYTVNVCVDI